VNRAKRSDRRHLLATARYPTRRDGAIALALFLLPWVAAVILGRRHHHLDGGAAGILVAVSLGLPTLWVTWAAYRGPRRSDTSTSGLSMAQIADQLAIAVGNQWNDEAAVRRLNDPYPLPVSWNAADASLTDPWDSLVKLVTSGAGWPPPPSEGTWVAGPEDLAGEGGELVEVIARVPTARLVVLGEPGAGKTILMIRLVLDLLARRASGGPVPILASVAAWNPATQDLRDWLAAQILIDHSALAAHPPAGMAESTQAEALLAAGLILPVLDGLDEIPEQVRGSAISRINDALRPGEHVVLTCRTQQYQDAVRPHYGVEVTLRGAAAVKLRSLDADAVRRYLCDDSAGPVGRARWAPVLDVLGTEAPAGQALSTPLMVGLARAIYNPRPGELAGALRDPAELCDPALAKRATVESLLFDAFIPAAYRQDPAGRWKAPEAERWLGFLARHLERVIIGPDLAWWQLPLAVPGFKLWLGGVVGVAVAVVVTTAVTVGVLAGVVSGLGDAAWIGILAGAMAGMIVGAAERIRTPARRIHWQPPSPGTVGIAAVAGVVGGVAAARFGVAGGVAGGIVGAAFGGIVSWSIKQKGTPLDISSAASPLAVLARDRRTAIVVGSVTGLVGGVVIGVGAGVGAVLGGGNAVAGGIGTGLAAGVLSGSCSGYLAALIKRRGRPMGWPAFGSRCATGCRGRLWASSPTPTDEAFSGKQARSTSSGTSNCSTGSPTDRKQGGRRARLCGPGCHPSRR
jgi:hypothetical protein